MRIETARLLIADFTADLAEAVHLGSLDEDTRRFLPDEVFPSVEIAAAVIDDLIGCYGSDDGPFVHPFLIRDTGVYAGYVQLVPLDEGWEIGYHTVRTYAGRGYATEALTAFLPAIAQRLHLTSVTGVCAAENAASIRVLEKCGFQPFFAGSAPYQGDIRPIVKYNKAL